jgi:hypothetical protein
MTDSQNKLHLQQTRDLINDPERWTTGVYARDFVGIGVEPDSPNAVCWCLIGAYAKVSGFSVCRAEQELNDMLDYPPTALNDCYPHQKVINKLDALIGEIESVLLKQTPGEALYLQWCGDVLPEDKYWQLMRTSEQDRWERLAESIRITIQTVELEAYFLQHIPVEECDEELIVQPKESDQDRRGDAGWQKSVAPPSAASRPAGLPPKPLWSDTTKSD